MWREIVKCSRLSWPYSVFSAGFRLFLIIQTPRGRRSIKTWRKVTKSAANSSTILTYNPSSSWETCSNAEKPTSSPSSRGKSSNTTFSLFLVRTPSTRITDLIRHFAARWKNAKIKTAPKRTTSCRSIHQRPIRLIFAPLPHFEVAPDRFFQCAEKSQHTIHCGRVGISSFVIGSYKADIGLTLPRALWLSFVGLPILLLRIVASCCSKGDWGWKEAS